MGEQCERKMKLQIGPCAPKARTGVGIIGFDHMCQLPCFKYMPNLFAYFMVMHLHTGSHGQFHMASSMLTHVSPLLLSLSKEAEMRNQAAKK